ncbi:hypothetical protein [Sinosporangium album]|uniref:hypothetical protein n=1 Tax=Sinosporangium album TaxID=504805 RepID=UPI0015A4E537|nr:hypothetical protein [Sinosporangium album]
MSAGPPMSVLAALMFLAVGALWPLILVHLLYWRLFQPRRGGGCGCCLEKLLH